MKRNVRKYLRDIKSLFPKFRKEERKYLNGFKNMIEDCPDDEFLSNRDMLESVYGTPEEVVRGFYAGNTCTCSGKVEDRYISKYISLARKKFRFIRKQEEVYLQNKTQSIEDWFSDRELRNVGDIINVFGDPAEIYTEYLGLHDNGSYLGRYRSYRRKRIVVCACTLVLVLLVTSVGQWIHFKQEKTETTSAAGVNDNKIEKPTDIVVQSNPVSSDTDKREPGIIQQNVDNAVPVNMKPDPVIEGYFTNKNADVVIGYSDISCLKCSISDVGKYTGLEVGTYRIDMPENIDAGNNYLIQQLVEGNKDIDIFILYANTPLSDLLDEEGICYPLNSSQIISEENEMIFDGIADGFRTEKGDIWGIPCSYYMNVIAALPGNMEREGLSDDIFEDIFTMTEALKGLSIVDINKKVYVMGVNYGYDLLSSYIANNKGNTDYNSKLFRDYFTTMWDDWLMYSQSGWGNHRLLGSGLRTVKIDGKKKQIATYNLAKYFDEENTLFNMVTEREILTEDILPDGARIYPIPPVSKDYKPEYNGSLVMVINPNSRHKENAVKVLEAVTEFTHQTGQLGVVYEDIDAYPDFYETDSDIFKQIYDINKNAIFSPGGITESVWCNDIRPYQLKETDLDTVIKIIQEKETALNELIKEKTEGVHG